MADSRRIVLVGPMYPYRGGIAHLSETMAAYLLDRGHKVHAITFTRQYPALLFPGRTQYETGAEAERAVEAERRIDTINPFSWWRAVRRVNELGAEVVIFRYWMPFFAPVFGTMARILARNGIKSLVVVDNALPHERRPGDIALGRYFFGAMQGCVVMSSAVDRDLDQLGVSCSRVLAPHPVYDSFGKPSDRTEARAKMGLAEDLPVILFFGFVRRYKGLHVLLDSMPVVRQTLPDICLLVAGEFYDDEEPYQKKVEVLDLQKQVKLVNQYIPKDEVANYFAAADVVVQPYLSATQSGVAQVAYQFEVPIITTDVGGLAEIVPHEEAGLIVPPNDATALASAIVRYFVDDMQVSLTAGVRRQKQSLGWDKLLDAIESVM
ncbi:MAG: glycosyltransferase [Bacteroidetes bacterium]|nr:glycosyltransferase [Bacteroidota bacterium]